MDGENNGSKPYQGPDRTMDGQSMPAPSPENEQSLPPQKDHAWKSDILTLLGPGVTFLRVNYFFNFKGCVDSLDHWTIHFLLENQFEKNHIPKVVFKNAPSTGAASKSDFSRLDIEEHRRNTCSQQESKRRIHLNSSSLTYSAISDHEISDLCFGNPWRFKS